MSNIDEDHDGVGVFGCTYILLIKDGPIQAVVRKGQWYLLSCLYCAFAEVGEVRCDQVHEEEVRFSVEGEEAEVDSGAKHTVEPREHNKDDRGAL